MAGKRTGGGGKGRRGKQPAVRSVKKTAGKGSGKSSCGTPSSCSTPSSCGSKATEFHVCMGLNSCQGQDKDGTASMAGTGNCATVNHVCHGANDCRGQGACGYLGDPEQQGHPGENPCRSFGSCASPVNVGRISTVGFNKGKSVWKLARKLFEQRMYEIGRPFGPPPGDGIADDEVPSWYVGSSCSSCS